MKTKHPLSEMKSMAEDLAESLRPFTERVMIAGSIRRGCDLCSDVELVVVPRWEPSQLTDLFGNSELLNRAWDWAIDAQARGSIQWIKPGTSEIIPWEPKRDGKYWRGLLPGGVKLDLFLATPTNFGLISLIRTGSAEFSQAVVTHARRVGMRAEGGRLMQGDEEIPTPDELDVFNALGLVYLSPEGRVDGSVLRSCARQDPPYSIQSREDLAEVLNG